MKKFKVAVFAHQTKRGWRYHAYTQWYNPQWPGCYMMDVTAANGSDAKKKAIALARKEGIPCPAP